MDFSKTDTALVVIDPQNDVLSEKGVSWGLVGDSVKENGTVENLERLFEAAKGQGYGVFISPHYLYPHDQAWGFGGAAEMGMLHDKEFFRPDPLGREGLAGSGADWLDRYKPFIEDGKTIVVSPHKVWGPQTNDLVLQLRKRGVGKIILAGMLANLCVESHLRELVEQGFDEGRDGRSQAPQDRRRLQGGGRQLRLHRERSPDDRRGGDGNAVANRVGHTTCTKAKTEMTAKLAGKIALITGGSSGLGQQLNPTSCQEPKR